MKALTWRGFTEFPADIKIFEAGKLGSVMAGDTVTSVYVNEGKYYACWDSEVLSNSSVIAKALGDSGLHIKTGIYQGEDAIYCRYRAGKYFLIEVTGSYVKNNQTLYEGKVTDQEISVQDNLYYTLPVTWPQVDYKIHLSKPPSPLFKDRHLYKYIRWINYLPRYAASVSCDLAEGKGKLTKKKDISRTEYQFSIHDLNRGSVTFNIVATPLKNAAPTPEGLSKTLTLTW